MKINKWTRDIIIALLILSAIMLSSVYLLKKTQVVKPVDTDVVRVEGIYGKASYYDYCLKDGWCSYGSLVAASRDFARYSTVKVTNIHNGKSVNVKITDFGPMDCKDRILNGYDTVDKCKERVIDLSSHAFSQLELLQYGLQDVVVELVEGPKK